MREDVVAHRRTALAAAISTQWARRVEAGGVGRQVWWLPSGNPAADRPAERELLDRDDDVYNVVVPRGAQTTMPAACHERGLRWRLFTVPPAVDDLDSATSGVPRLLRVLAGLHTELSHRRPGYPNEHPLRVVVEPGARSGVVTADAVADVLCRIATDDQVVTHWWLRADPATPLQDVCRAAREAWRLPVETVPDRDGLTPADQYLDDLIACAQWPSDDVPATAVEHPVPAVEPSALTAVLRSAATAHRQSEAAVRARELAVPGLLGDVRLELADGGVVHYRTAGTGDPPLVAVNAIGQGLGYWYPLLARLFPQRRVLIWELRDERPDGSPTRVSDHVDDLGAILAAERIAECDLLGWCAGAKIAIRYRQREWGRVRSLILLNGAFKHAQRDPELDSPYERNLERICRTLARRPERADTLRRVLNAEPPEEVAPDQVLAVTDSRLRDEVNRPFTDAVRLIRYACQMLDFWSVDVSADLAAADVPVLLVSCEYDQVVGMAGIRAAAALAPRSQLVELGGGTHYRMFERPDLVATVIEQFLREVGEPAQY